jgi:dephospho-CoA kinase
MTPEQRLNRVERILGFFVKEGRRWRVRSREQDEKINMLIQSQMETTEQINRSSVIHEREMTDLRRSLHTLIKSLSKDRNGLT